MATYFDPATGKYFDEEDSAVASAAPEPSGMLRRTVGDAATSLAKGVLVGIPQAAVGLGRLATLGMADPLLNPVSDTLKGMEERFNKSYSTQHKQQAQEVADTKGFMPTIGAYLSRPGYLADSIVEQVPAIFAGGMAGRAAVGTKATAAAAAAGPEAVTALATKAGAIGEGLTTAGQNIEQVDQSLRADTGENSTLGSKLLAGMGGVVTGGISFGAGKLANKLKITDLDTLAAGGGRGAGVGSTAGRVGKGVLTEGVLEELPQSMQEQMWNNAAMDRPLTEGVAEAGAQGLVLGGAMGGGAQLMGKRVDPAAIAHNNRMRDALAGIAVLTEPQEMDENGNAVVTKAHTDSLANIASYAEHVEGADIAKVKEWQSAQLEALNAGTAVNFDGVPGVANDTAARTWAENRRAEIAARQTAGDSGMLVDDFGNETNTQVRPETASRSLTAQEKAETAMLDKALAEGDMGTVARLQNKLYARERQAAPPPAAATTVTPPAAPAAAPAKPSEAAKPYVAPATIEQIVPNDLFKHLRQFGSKNVKGMQDTIKDVMAYVKAGNPALAAEQVSDLTAKATDNKPQWEEFARVLNQYLPSEHQINVQATPVGQGTESESATGQTPAAVPKNNSGPATEGVVAAKSTQKAKKEKVKPAAKKADTVEEEVAAQAAKEAAALAAEEEAKKKAPIPQVGDAVVTGYGKHGVVTKVDANGNTHVKMGSGDTVVHTRKTIADGQLKVVPAAMAQPAKGPAPKQKEVEPTAEDWEKAYRTAQEQAGKLGLVLPKMQNLTPPQADAALKKLAEKVSKIKDDAARTQMREAVVKARDATTAEMGRRKAAFKAEVEAKDAAKVADATKVLQETADTGRLLPPKEHWEQKRAEAARAQGVSPEGFYIAPYGELSDKVRTAWEKGDRKEADFRAAADAAHQERAAETAKHVNNLADTLLSNNARAYDRFMQMMALANMMLKLEGHNTKGTVSLLVDGKQATMPHAEAVNYVVGEYNKFLRTATNKSAPIRTLLEMRDRLGAEMAEITPKHTAEEYRAMSAEQFTGEVTKRQKEVAAAMAKYLRANPVEMTNSQKESLKEKMDLLKELGAKLKDKNGKSFVPKGSWEFKDAVDTFAFFAEAAGNTIPSLKAVLEETHGTTRLGEVLAAVGKLTSKETHRTLARLLAPLVRNVQIRYSDESVAVVTDDGLKFRHGLYSADTNTITIYGGGENPHTILHEIVHAATVANMRRVAGLIGKARTQADVQAVKGYHELVSLFESLKNTPGLSNEYAFTNLYEFVAEVYTNPTLQAKLSATPVPEGLLGATVAKIANMMDAFVHAVRNMLGFNAGQTDALTRAIELTSGFFDGGAAPSTGSFDALSSPVAALTALGTRLPAFTQQVDKWVKNTRWEDLKAKARKTWMGLVSSDYIKDMVENSPGLGAVADAIEGWFENDRKKTQVKNLIAKDVYDGFVRKLEAALAATGDYTTYNEIMGTLAGEASRLGFDLTMNFEQNVAARAKGQLKLDPKMRQEINRLHQKFTNLQRSHPAIATLILEGEKVNRKLYTMQMATIARNILDSHASGPSSDAAANILRQFDKKLDILMDANKLQNTDAGMHLDGLASTLHDNLMALFAMFEGPNTTNAKGDLHDDMKAIQTVYAKAWASPYMHLGRHGMNHVAFSVADTGPQTVAKLNSLLGSHGFVLGPFAKGSSEVFLRVDSRDEMMQIFYKLKATKGIITEKDGKQSLRAGALSEGGADNMAGVSKAMEGLRKRMEAQFESKKGQGTATPAMKAAFDEMKAMLNQEFLDMLDINSAKQVNQVRKGVVGYSSDYMQNFAKRAQWSDASVSNQYTTRGYTKAFHDMQQTVTDLQGVDPLQASKGQDIVDELATRFANSLKPNTNPVMHALSVFGHNFYLALSPAYTIGNLLQPYMLTLPLLGGRYGFVKASKTMSGATADTYALVKAAVKTGWNETGWRGILDAKLNLKGMNLKQEELEFLQHLIRSGIVDATQSQELARMAKGESSNAATAAKVMSTFNHYSEVFNRLSAGLAAYRLSADMKTEAERTAYAIDIVRRTQYDYADHNKARFIGRHGVLGAATPLFMQFQTFAFFTMENYIRMFKDGFINDLPAPERAQAIKALGGTLTATALVAGTMGLPFATVLAALANAAGGGDDKDARAKFRDWLASMFGKEGAEIIAKGVPRAAGIDLSGSLGHQDLLPGSRWMADRRQWDDKVKDMSKSMLGPAVNAGFDIHGGVEKVSQGDVMGGIKAIMPRFLKGPVEALKTAEEGAFVNKAGTTLPMPVTSWNYFTMALGFNPAKKAEQSEANFYYQSQQAQTKQDKKLAQKEALRAHQAGDLDEMNDILTEYNMAHATDPLRNLGSVVRTQARAQAAAVLSGSGILDSNRKHLPTMAEYGAYNTGIE